MKQPDIVLIGAGIMSATLATFFKELNPNCTISIYEVLEQPALESSDAWNNAGTGHSAFCELNYTKQNIDGSISTEKAVKIAENFEVSKQFWSYLIENNKLTQPSNFIHSTPHLSFVFGNDNVNFLKKRYEAMIQNPLFSDMIFTDDTSKIASWIPLVMENRSKDQKVAATYMGLGTDINFGALTRSLFDTLSKQEGISIYYNHKVKNLKQKKDQSWRIKIKNKKNKEEFKINSKFVFIGAGGASLLLLDKADIKEGAGYGGFPVGGQWLKCVNPEIIKKHHTKVYGKASVGSPPMSVPHLDSRVIDGKKELLFGPFAGFSTKFLKNGSYLDLVKSIELDNIKPMLYAGWNNMPLTKYLIKQVLQSNEDRIAALQDYFPNAKLEDWELLDAGQRVQIIKKDEEEGGILEFGTEIISSEDNTLACLLGASPGASTSVSIMLEVLNLCFPNQMKTQSWQEKLQLMIPSYQKSLNDDEALCKIIRQRTSKILKLEND